MRPGILKRLCETGFLPPQVDTYICCGCIRQALSSSRWNDCIRLAFVRTNLVANICIYYIACASSESIRPSHFNKLNCFAFLPSFALFIVIEFLSEEGVCVKSYSFRSSTNEASVLAANFKAAAEPWKPVHSIRRNDTIGQQVICLWLSVL